MNKTTLSYWAKPKYWQGCLFFAQPLVMVLFKRASHRRSSILRR